MKLLSTGVADKEDFLQLEMLEKKLDAQPNDYNLLLSKALLVYYPFLSTDQAEEIFDFIETVYPNTYETAFWHGTMLFFYDAHYEKAIKLLYKAIKINDKKNDAYIVLAQLIDEMGGNIEEAKLFLTKALKTEQYWPGIWYGLISLSIKQNQFNEARKLIKDALCHIPLDYVRSSDIIQGCHDRLVSGRVWALSMEDDLARYLKTIEDAENSNAK